MTFEDSLASFVQAWCAEEQRRREVEQSRRRIEGEIARLRAEIRRQEVRARRQPRAGRYVAELAHQIRHHEIELAFLEAPR